MTRVLIDTCAFSALFAGDQRIADELERGDEILLSPIVLGELLDGFEGGSRKRENRARLEAFRQKPRSVLVPIVDSTSEWFAEIKRGLRAKGRPIPINDVWIAASCMEHGARLLSIDSHFEEIDGLLRVDLGIFSL